MSESFIERFLHDMRRRNVKNLPPSCKETRASEEEHSIIKSKHFGILTLLLLIHWKSFTIVRFLYKIRSAKRFCFDVETKLKAFIKLSQQFIVSLLKGNWKGKYIKQNRKSINGKVLTVNSLWWKTSYRKQIKRKWISNAFFYWLQMNSMPSRQIVWNRVLFWYVKKYKWENSIQSLEIVSANFVSERFFKSCEMFVLKKLSILLCKRGFCIWRHRRVDSKSLTYLKIKQAQNQQPKRRVL